MAFTILNRALAWPICLTQAENSLLILILPLYANLMEAV